MRIVHTADWHLGKFLYGRSLLPDQEHFVKGQFLPWVAETRPDLVVLAGDIFDRAVAPAEALRLFDQFLVEMNRLGIPLAAIAGNHDGPDRMAVGAALLRNSGVYLAARPEDVLHPAELDLPGGGLRLFLLPYCEPAQVRELLGDGSLHTYQQAYAALLGEAARLALPGRVNLLAAHCFAAGGAVSASESPLYVGGTGEVSPSCFDPFDYAALGHLHAPQRAGAKGRYAGSPLKYSFDEANQAKSVTVVEFGAGEPQVSFQTFPPLHDVRQVSGLFEEVLAQARENPCEDYLLCELTDDSPVYLPMDRLRPYWPNLLGISSLWLSRAGSGDSAALREQLHRRAAGDAQVLEQFLQQICGREMEEGDRELFLQALRDGEEDAE